MNDIWTNPASTTKKQKTKVKTCIVTLYMYVYETPDGVYLLHGTIKEVVIGTC